MKLLCVLFVLASAIDIPQIYAASSDSYDPVIMQYPYHSTQDFDKSQGQTGCYVHTLDKVIPYDTQVEKVYPDDGSCEYYTCEEETWNAYQFSCRSIPKKIKDGCKVVEGDESQKFPACCSRVICD